MNRSEFWTGHRGGANLRTEMICETSQNREDISKSNSRIDALEAAKEQGTAK